MRMANMESLLAAITGEVEEARRRPPVNSTWTLRALRENEI